MEGVDLDLERILVGCVLLLLLRWGAPLPFLPVISQNAFHIVNKIMFIELKTFLVILILDVVVDEKYDRCIYQGNPISVHI
jgi:hypothetical protein